MNLIFELEKNDFELHQVNPYWRFKIKQKIQVRTNENQFSRAIHLCMKKQDWLKDGPNRYYHTIYNFGGEGRTTPRS